MIKALSDGRVMYLLTRDFNATTEAKLTLVVQNIEEIHVENNKIRDDRIEPLELKVVMEQRDKRQKHHT